MSATTAESIEQTPTATRQLAQGHEPPLAAHLTTPRGLYTHHGLYVGHGRVICEHFCEWCLNGEARSAQVEAWRARPLAALLALAIGLQTIAALDVKSRPNPDRFLTTQTAAVLTLASTSLNP